MAVILSVLVRVLIQKSVDLIEAEVQGILTFNAKKELEKLRLTLSIVQGVLEDAEEKQVIKDGLRLWLSSLKEAAYDAEDLLHSFHYELLRRQQLHDHHPKVKEITTKFRGFLSISHNPLLFRKKISNKLKGIVGKFDALASERTKFDLQIRDGSGCRDHRSIAAIDTRTQSHSGIQESGLIGREADVRKIAGILTSEELKKHHHVSVLPIVGMGGLGKTTLAKMVYNDPTVKGYFDLFIWVSVGHEFSPEKIAKTMIEIVTGTGFGLSDMESMHKNLRKLIGSKRYLLVLDDVWSEDDLKWQDLHCLLTFGSQGSAILATTRSGRVASVMGTHDTHWLAELSDDDCWVLLKQRVFAVGTKVPSELEAVGKEIAKRCGGLPLAAQALGGLMRRRPNEKEWKSILDSEIWDLNLGKDGILPALKVSYFYLPSSQKQCFTFCSLFPKDYRIEKDMLIKLWIANGFVPSTPSASRSPEREGNDIFEDLQQGSFFIDVKEVERYDGRRITTCRMHDHILDLARSIMGAECCCSTLVKWDEISSSKFRHLLINCEGDAATTLSSSSKKKASSIKTMRTLVFRRSGDHPSPSILWSKIKYLRALSLQNMAISEFPISICELNHLRYLDLSRNDIKELVEGISMLLSLQILNLSACKLLVGLPKTLSSMRSLVHIYLDGCTSLLYMPRGIRKLLCLQTLTRYTAGKGAECGSLRELKDIDLHGDLELCNLHNVTNAEDAEEAYIISKENLQRIGLDWGEVDSTTISNECDGKIIQGVLQALCPHQNLRELAIRHYTGIGFPKWLMGDLMMILPNLVEVALVDCSRCEYLPEFWRLSALEALEIGNTNSLVQMGGVGFYGGDEGNDTVAFPSLKKLKLYNLGRLKEWGGVDAKLSPFPCIAQIEISDCPELRTVPAILSVSELRINNCPRLSPSKGFYSNMPYLQSLEIHKCDPMIILLEEEEAEDVGASLRHLKLGNCEKAMFASASYGMWRHMRYLKNLEIRYCDGLVILPKEVLKELVALKGLLIHCCYELLGTSFSEEGLGFQGLSSVEVLDIQVNTSFPCFQPEGLLHLPALRMMRIYSNHGLTTLPNFSGSLRELSIYNCWSLRSFPPGLGSLLGLECIYLESLNWVEEFPEAVNGYKALNSLTIIDCQSMKSFPVSLQKRLPALGYLRITRSSDLERKCIKGGEYWNYVSRVAVRYIGDGAC